MLYQYRLWSKPIFSRQVGCRNNGKEPWKNLPDLELLLRGGGGGRSFPSRYIGAIPIVSYHGGSIRRGSLSFGQATAAAHRAKPARTDPPFRLGAGNQHDVLGDLRALAVN